MNAKNVFWFEEIGTNDLVMIGAKNASLAEMFQRLSKAGVRIPNGFVTSTAAYRSFFQQNGLQHDIVRILHGIDFNDKPAIDEISRQICNQILALPLLPDFVSDIENAFINLMAGHDCSTVAVRSSIAVDDFSNILFTGQQETYLHLQTIDEVLMSLKKLFASLYSISAIEYRMRNNISHEKIALSVAVQLMVRSDIGTSGIAISKSDAILVNVSYGVGDAVVHGFMSPDEYCLARPNPQNQQFSILSKKLGDKPVKVTYGGVISTSDLERRRFALQDDDLLELANYVLVIEKYYGQEMHIEWARDGVDGKLYIVHARPEKTKKRNKRAYSRGLLSKIKKGA